MASSEANPLVSTKLCRARPSRRLVARTRLHKLLARQPEQRLVLLSAPAGYGKTTLLHAWIEAGAREGRAVAWVSLDAGDNDPARFLSYLIAALERAGATGFGGTILAALRSPAPPRLDPLLGALINELAALPGELDLVLDDYHVVEADEVRRIVAFLLERLPERARLVIAGRTDPHLPLALLLARAQLVEIRAADLRFTTAEVAAFLGDTMGLDLPPGDVAALERVTEGWIAALQLAALSLRGRADAARIVSSFSGGQRDVFDFLAEEVFERQPEPLQSFLLHTAILATFCGPLCDALTGDGDGQRTLERLERENLFVVALDDERGWYRYHHLFADFLRRRLERDRPGLDSALHRKAAAWYEEHGPSAEAIHHALAAGDHEQAARLIARGETWYRGEVATLLGWLRQLPAGALRRRPRLLVWYASTLLLTGQLGRVEPLLREAEGAVEAAGAGRGEGPDEHVLAIVAASRSLLARVQGDPAGAIAHARRALTLLPADNLNPRPFATICLAEAYLAADDLAAAQRAFAEAAALGKAAGHDYITLASIGAAAHLRVVRGRLHEAEAALRQALAFVAARQIAHLPAVGRIRIALGELCYERGELEDAERELAQGAQLAERSGELEFVARSKVALSRTRQARGDGRAALDLADEAERLALEVGTAPVIARASLWRARLQLMGEDWDAASDTLGRISGAGGAPRAVRLAERAARARLHLARGEGDEALRLLDGVREAAEAADRDGGVIEILTLQALALRATGRGEQARETLRQALILGAAEAYVRTFVDEGPPMAALLAELLAAWRRAAPESVDSTLLSYADRLLAALRQDGPDAAMPAFGPPDPLTEREREVLRQLAAGKSNRQIAAALFVSAGTVKTHCIKIYRKLDAHSRTQALARARERHLI